MNVTIFLKVIFPTFIFKEKRKLYTLYAQTVEVWKGYILNRLPPKVNNQIIHRKYELADLKLILLK